MKALFLTLLLLAGCANKVPPKYQEYGVNRYSEWDLKVDNPYRVAYYPKYDYLIQVTMDSNKSIYDVKDFIDLYAAELTLKKGYSYYSYEVQKTDHKKVTWSGGGIKGTTYYPFTLLFIKFQNSAKNGDVVYEDAKSIVGKLNRIYPLKKIVR